MSEEKNLAVLQRAIACFGSPATNEEYFELYDPNVVLHGYAGVEPGLNNVKQFYAGIWSAFPDVGLTVEDMFGKPIALAGITILRFEDGKCVERWSQADFLSVLMQIGAIPAPA